MGSRTVPFRHESVTEPGGRKHEETYECMCFRAKELSHIKYPARLANQFVDLGTTENCREKVTDEWPGEWLEE